jgi:hypothetical protein
MPEKRTVQRARKAKKEGKAPTTQAGEFVREEMEHEKSGKHSRGNAKQAIAIGLSKARRAGVKLPPPKKGKTSAATRKKAERDYKAGQSKQASTKKSASKRTSSAASHRKTSGKSGSRTSGSRKSAARTTRRSTAGKSRSRKRSR